MQRTFAITILFSWFTFETSAVQVDEKEVEENRPAKHLWHCHWFPMQESRPQQPCPNKLCAVSGPLDKLDRLTGRKARLHEYRRNFNRREEPFSLNATAARRVLKKPKHSVAMQAADGSEVIFDVPDIQSFRFDGSHFSEYASEFWRNNPAYREPAGFLDLMQRYAKDERSLIFWQRFDGGYWPIDRVVISEWDRRPGTFMDAPAEARFYLIKMQFQSSFIRHLQHECWVAPDGSGGWIHTPCMDDTPEFPWHALPIGDLTDRTLWQLHSRPSNPEIDPQIVCDIYSRSLAEDKKDMICP